MGMTLQPNKTSMDLWCDTDFVAIRTQKWQLLTEQQQNQKQDTL